MPDPLDTYPSAALRFQPRRLRCFWRPVAFLSSEWSLTWRTKCKRFVTTERDWTPANYTACPYCSGRMPTVVRARYASWNMPHKRWLVSVAASKAHAAELAEGLERTYRRDNELVSSGAYRAHILIDPPMNEVDPKTGAPLPQRSLEVCQMHDGALLVHTNFVEQEQLTPERVRQYMLEHLRCLMQPEVEMRSEVLGKARESL